MAKNMGDFLKKLGVKKNLTEKVESKKTPDVVDEDDVPLPTAEVQCPECDNNEVYWWTKQTRASDEPETRFMKCTKCKHTWRDAS